VESRRGAYDATGEQRLGSLTSETLAGAGDAPRGTLAAQEGIRPEGEEPVLRSCFAWS
jgi:hypothetical protein